MPLPGFDDLAHLADDRAPGSVVSVAGGANRTVLDALRQASDRGWISPLVVGPEHPVRAIADRSGIDLDGFAFLNTDDDLAAPAAVDAVKSGCASILMKGTVSSPILISAVADPELACGADGSFVRSC